jgi:sterol desaturase/sphingolipid hydroxylase (fatty acid hydroxylase superfamily)
VALLLVIGADFATYWFHRVFHEVSWLWPIHALHHSAEELNPVTAYRHHPVFEVFGAIVASLMAGAVQGLLLAFVVGSFDVAVVGGANVFFAVFNVLGANLRHSHVWLHYPNPLGYFLISPAQHQIHHSIDPRHHNRNYGEVLAIWDWMFGTLYVPEGYEEIRFGLGDGKGGRIAQPHPNLKSALVTPLRELAAKLRGG